MQVTTVGGRKTRYRRGGFATREAAATARQAVLDDPADEAAAGAWTVARWLRYWLKMAEPHLRPSTVHSYRDHVDRYLIPSLGRLTLADLTAPRLQACFDLLARQRTRNGDSDRRVESGPGPGHTAVGAERRRPRRPARQ